MRRSSNIILSLGLLAGITLFPAICPAASAAQGAPPSPPCCKAPPPPVQGNIRVAAGDRIDDGTVYAGIARRRDDDAGAETDERLYTTQEAVRRHYNWREAAEYCAALDTQGHRDWRVPTKDELKLLYNNHDAIGGFDTSGVEGFGWYWSSSSEDGDNAWALRFSDGLPYRYLKDHAASVRCVR